MKVILFILSLQRYARLPFLLVSTPSALPVWENELSHLAPSVNVVVYSGKKDVRKCIRTLEFYEEHGRVMFEVLVSSPEDVVEVTSTTYIFPLSLYWFKKFSRIWRICLANEVIFLLHKVVSAGLVVP